MMHARPYSGAPQLVSATHPCSPRNESIPPLPAALLRSSSERAPKQKGWGLSAATFSKAGGSSPMNRAANRIPLSRSRERARGEGRDRPVHGNYSPLFSRGGLSTTLVFALLWLLPQEAMAAFDFNHVAKRAQAL